MIPALGLLDGFQRGREAVCRGNLRHPRRQIACQVVISRSDRKIAIFENLVKEIAGVGLPFDPILRYLREYLLDRAQWLPQHEKPVNAPEKALLVQPMEARQLIPKMMRKMIKPETDGAFSTFPLSIGQVLTTSP